MAPKPPVSSHSSLWSRLDASNPKLSLRDLFDENEPTSQGLPSIGTVLLALGVLIAFLILSCCCLALCKNKIPFIPATVHPPIRGHELVDQAHTATTTTTTKADVSRWLRWRWGHWSVRWRPEWLLVGGWLSEDTYI